MRPAAQRNCERTLYRKLGAYSVACYAQQFQALESAGALEPLPNGSAILTDSTLYDPKTGLSMDVETGKVCFSDKKLKIKQRKYIKVFFIVFYLL